MSGVEVARAGVVVPLMGLAVVGIGRLEGWPRYGLDLKGLRGSWRGSERVGLLALRMARNAMLVLGDRRGREWHLL